MVSKPAKFSSVFEPVRQSDLLLFCYIMSIPLTDGTTQSLRAYLREVKATHSEIGKRERFASLLGTLFPNQREIGIYARGAETSLRIKTPEKARTGRADTIFGSAVVEFE